MTSDSSPENPHLTDIFRTALSRTPATQEDQAIGPEIVINGNNNVVAFGGRVVIQERATTARRRSTS